MAQSDPLSSVVVLSKLGYGAGVGAAAVVYPLLGASLTVVLAGGIAVTCGLLGWGRFGLEKYAPHRQEMASAL